MAQSTVQQLEDIARDVSLKADPHCTVNFVFTPNSIGRMVRKVHNGKQLLQGPSSYR